VVFFKDLSLASAGTGYVWHAKAKLLLIKLIHLFAREVLLVTKLEIEETETTYRVNH
jgi:hypothetical protein